MAARNDGANGTAIRKMLERRWVRIMVFNSPILRETQGAIRCDTAFSACTAKNRTPSACSEAPKRRKNQYGTSASVRKPPPSASMENSAASRKTMRLVAAETGADNPAGVFSPLTSTSCDIKKYSDAEIRLTTAYP